jgi:opacity protein-like surface antigen
MACVREGDTKMRLKLLMFPILAASFLAATVPAFSQTGAAYERSGMPISVGFGPSSYDVDWGHGRMLGGTIWADWYPSKMPSFLRGLGVEGEVRDISLDKHAAAGQTGRSGQDNTRQDTASAGAIYSWRRFRNFHPYGKLLIGDGSVDFLSSSPTYSHDTRTVFSAGGGLEYRFLGQLWVRADYEYQDWGILLGNTLNPQGFTVGVAYDFGHASPSKY